MGAGPGKDYYLAPDYKQKAPKSIAVHKTIFISEEEDIKYERFINGWVKEIRKKGYMPVEATADNIIYNDSQFKTTCYFVDLRNFQRVSTPKEKFFYKDVSSGYLNIELKLELINVKNGEVLWRDTFARKFKGTGSEDDIVKSLLDPMSTWGMNYYPLVHFPPSQ